MRCLVNKFVSRFGCLHARLAPVSKRERMELGEIKECDFATLKEHVNGTVEEGTTDPGLEAIRRIYHAFDVSSKEKSARCECPRPCQESRYT